jgi:hypothetical protein
MSAEAKRIEADLRFHVTRGGLISYGPDQFAPVPARRVLR